MRKNRNILISPAMNKIAQLCLFAWILGMADHSCRAADDDKEPIADREGEITKQITIMEKVPMPAIPPVAQGDKKIYERFLEGVLIYRPNGNGNDVGRINLPIRRLANPLGGTFDLSECGKAWKYLIISTGYRKEKKAGNERKIEIWFAPRFLIEKELETTARHYKPIFNNWGHTAQVGIFWTWGDCDNLAWYDYSTSESMDKISNDTLYEKWARRNNSGRAVHGIAGATAHYFTLSFVN